MQFHFEKFGIGPLVECTVLPEEGLFQEDFDLGSGGMQTETLHGPLQAQAIDKVFVDIWSVIPRTTDEGEIALHPV